MLECLPVLEGDDLVLRFRGDMTSRRLGNLLDLGKRIDLDGRARIVVDLSGIRNVAGIGVAALAVFFKDLERRRIPYLVRDPSTETLRVLRALRLPETVLGLKPARPADESDVVDRLGLRAAALEDNFFRYVGTVRTALYETFLRPFSGESLRMGEVVRGVVRMGFDAFPLLTFMGFLIGFSIALGTVPELQAFGQEIRIADVVGRAMTRSIGPLMTACLVAGRSGGAIAAEIGTMKVSEELDALRAMGLSPVGFHVAPRFRALLLVLPCLTVFTGIAGVIGGTAVMSGLLGIPLEAYVRRTVETVKFADFFAGMAKAVLFAFVIATSAAHQGLSTSSGAAGVGRATTRCVVWSLIGIVIVEAAMTAILYALGK